jgi:hypothetical protein
MLAAADPIAAELVRRALDKKEDPHVSVRAALGVLDRCGLGATRRVEVEVEGKVTHQFNRLDEDELLLYRQLVNRELDHANHVGPELSYEDERELNRLRRLASGAGDIVEASVVRPHEGDSASDSPDDHTALTLVRREEN